MKKLIIISIIAAAGCQTNTNNSATDTSNSAVSKTAAIQQTIQTNPFFSSYQTPYQIPPFDQIKDQHYMPAMEAGMAAHKIEIEAIINNPKPASFNNTIEAMEWSGSQLTNVASVFYNMTSANTNENLQKIQAKLGPILSGHQDDILLNEGLFKRVKAVYAAKDSLELRVDQAKLLEDTYKSFVRGGANLEDKSKTKLRKINSRLSELTIKFGSNLLAETNAFELIVDSKKDLDGLADNIIQAASDEAKRRADSAAKADKNKYQNKWVFTAHRPSKTPFLTYSSNRELRKKMYFGYTHRGDNGNANDNNLIVAEIASLRLKRARLLGYNTHADFVLEERNAKNAKNIYKLFDQVWPATLAKAKIELADIQKMVDDEGGKFKVQAWDWRYYSEKIRKARYNFDEAETRPYFSLDATIKGLFFTANKLFDLSFKERTDLPKYHPDVRTFEVLNKAGDVVGIYLMDHFVRKSKRGGAWMNSYRKQYKIDAKNILPIIVNVTNFPKSSGDQPTLLTFDQARTTFHEFGHALHGLLSDGVYQSQTGTAVPRDYVEFPSQVMEYWFGEAEVLNNFAMHYQTGEVIPEALLRKIQKASTFNQGFFTGEYMAASYLDLAWYTLEDEEIQNTREFEAKAMKDIGLIEQITPRYRSTYFSHIFSGGYSAGYYSYLWTDVLAADAFQAFKENGLFDKATAAAFKKYIFSAGGTDDSMTLYRRFRGKDPEIEPLLKSKGLIDSK